MFVKRKGVSTYHMANRGFTIDAWTTRCGQTIRDKQIGQVAEVVLTKQLCRDCKRLSVGPVT